MPTENQFSKIEKAKIYYYFFVSEFLVSYASGYVRTGTLYPKFLEMFGMNQASPKNEIHRQFIAFAIQDFSRMQYSDVIEDDFAEAYIRANDDTAELRGDPVFQKFSEKYQDLDNSAREWLTSAFYTIANSFSIDELTEYQKEMDSNEAATVLSDFADDAYNAGDEIDAWSPLQINREDPSIRKAIEAAESALKEIESSNGYAVAEAEERNAVVSTIRGTLDAIKTGFPSKPAIISGLLAPLKFIAKKFSEASMGEAAKIAVAAIVKWLF